MSRLAIIGTNGVPSNYGGFETLVEFIATYLSQEHEITIFCSSQMHRARLETYKGCRLIYLPLGANGWQSVFYDILSIVLSIHAYDKLLILGSSGAIFLPLLLPHRSKILMNIGGLDWQRSKWSWWVRRFLKLSESLAVRFSGTLISDNLGIQEYLLQEYGKKSIVIAYGGDHVANVSPEQADKMKYPFLENPYALSVARIQPDNNIETILKAFQESKSMPLVFVGNWANSTYGRQIRDKYSPYPHIHLLDAIYDQRELDLIRSNCSIYIHGHSAGGTNPALVEAMYLGLPVVAFDCVFNRYTTKSQAVFFKTSEDITHEVASMTAIARRRIGDGLKTIAQNNYRWDLITSQYSGIIENNLVAR